VPIFERDAKGEYHNSAAVIDIDGKLLPTYRKIHIPQDPLFYEKNYFKESNDGYRIYKTKYATIASRFTVGEKFTTTQQYGYWSANPYVAVPVGDTGFTALAGWRYRAAFDTNYLDTTRTWRGAVQYALTKQDTIGVRYDRVQGDADAKVWAFYYTRGF
jgi:hypothetical protein